MNESYYDKIKGNIADEEFIHAAIEVSSLLKVYPHDIELLKLCRFIFTQIFDTQNEIKPSNSRDFTERGIAYLFTQEISLAIEDFNLALTLDPNNDIAYWQRSFCFMIYDQLELAKNDLFKSIEISPKSIYYIDLAILYNKLEEYELGLIYLLQAREKDQNNLWLLYNLGMTYKNLGMVEEAMGIFNTIIKQWPDYELAILERNKLLDL